MRWKIQIINLGSKKKRRIKELKDYIYEIAARIQIFINELGEEEETKHLTAEDKLLKFGDFILKLQQKILEFRRNKYVKKKK